MSTAMSAVFWRTERHGHFFVCAASYGRSLCGACSATLGLSRLGEAQLCQIFYPLPLRFRKEWQNCALRRQPLAFIMQSARRKPAGNRILKEIEK